MIDNKVNKKHLLIYIFLFISIILVTLSTTYAWYDEEKANYNENIDIVVSASHEGIELVGSQLEVNDLVPSSEEEVKTSSFTLDETQCKNSNGDSICFLYEFTVTNNDVEYRNVLYNLIPKENTFTNLKFKIYSSSKDQLSNSSKINMLSTSLTRNDLNGIELTGMTRKITANESLTYTIVFWIEKQETDQTIADASKTFKADLSVELIATGFGYMDVDAPAVSNVTFKEITRSYNVAGLGRYTISWEGADAKSNISKFVIKIYDSTDNLIHTKETNGDTYSVTYNGILSDSSYETLLLDKNGTYYATVYAVDENGNSGQMSCGIEGTTECGKSASVTMKYRIYYTNSTQTCANGSVSPSTLYYGDSATVSIYLLEDCKNLTGAKVSYSSNYGGAQIRSGGGSVTNLQGDFYFSGYGTEDTSSCLAEGTKILLASGKYKNIEDITYNDLLVVIDYQNGGITYQYPNWIEKRLLSDSYIKITFSDDTIINVVGDHAFFSYDDNEFVTVSNKDKFHIGTRVAKLNNYKLDEVKVKNIEYINKETYYHHVISTRYYNIIAEDIVTTDDVVFVTNLYGFNKDITWKNPPITDVYTLEEISVAPNFVFRGLRMYDGKIFNSVGMNKEMFIGFLLDNQLKEEIWDKPKLNENGKRLWMVTTSEDVVTEENKLSYLMEEGDYYTLKNPKNINGKKFVGWLHTGENIMYNPGDKVEVIYGTHFIAKYEELFVNPFKLDKLS